MLVELVRTSLCIVGKKEGNYPGTPGAVGEKRCALRNLKYILILKVLVIVYLNFPVISEHFNSHCGLIIGTEVASERVNQFVLIQRKWKKWN
ncbi:hypothetical protein CHUAL_005094 [Chamberlinius hualienensis]